MDTKEAAIQFMSKFGWGGEHVVGYVVELIQFGIDSAQADVKRQIENLKKLGVEHEKIAEALFDEVLKET